MEPGYELLPKIVSSTAFMLIVFAVIYGLLCLADYLVTRLNDDHKTHLYDNKKDDL